MTQAFLRRLIDHAATPYRAAGRFAWHFARGKLGGDPVFAGLLRHGLIPDQARVLDIGCGQGLLASWLLSAKTMHAAGDWPADWPAAPTPRALYGIELMQKDVARARQALSDAGPEPDSDTDPRADRSALVASWWRTQAGLDVVHRVQHVHGGIGVDTDYPVHRFFLWGKQLSSTLGGPSATLAELGDALVGARP